MKLVFSIFNFVLSFSSDFKLKIIVVFILGLISMSLDVYFPKFIATFIDNILIAHQENALVYYFIFLFLIAFFSILSNFYSSLLGTKVNFLLKLNIYLYLTKIIKDIPSEEFVKQDKAYLSKRITTDVETVVSFVFGVILFFILKIFYFLLCLYFILSVGFLWLVYFLIIMTVYLIGYKLFKSIIEKLQKAVIESDNNFFSDLFFNINYSKEIKLHSLDYYGEKN